MAGVRTSIATQSPQGRSLQLSGEMLVNLYAEPAPPGARVQMVLRNAPGLKAFATGMGSGPIRAVREALGYAWALSGSTLYYMTSDGTAAAAQGQAIDPTGTAMLSDDGQTLTVQANISAYNVTSASATGTLTLSGNAAAAETVVIGSNTYTWRVFGTAYNDVAGEVLIGATASDSLDNLINAINRTGASGSADAGGMYSEATVVHPTVTAAAGAGDTMVITARTAGTAGNAIVTTETMGSGSWGAATLTGGESWTVAAITDPDFPGASSVDYDDGYTIFTEPDSGRWFISDLYDATSLDALDFTTAEGSPDDLVRTIVDHREVIAFGKRSIEVYANTGGADFPFTRIEGAFIERGCIAPASVAKMDNGVFWIGDDKIIYRMQGYQPARISTPAIEEVLRAATDIEDAEGWTYPLAGHHFYVLTLPTTAVTLVFDAQTSLWHQMRSGTGETGRWRAQWSCLAFGKTLVGDALDGNVFELDLDTFNTDNATARTWRARTPGLYADGNLARMYALELECELGVGIGSGQGSAPSVMMRYSNDGGTNWSPYSTASIGAMGSSRVRAMWRNLGAFRERIIEFSGSDPVKTTLFGMKHTSDAGVAP